MDLTQHDAEILDQFTKQAEPFLRRHEHSDTELLELMARCADVGPQDKLLDIACGPGIVSCFFAKRVARVSGLDMVPAMLERAKRLQSERNLTNMDWKLGQSTALPFNDGAFDGVVTRFSFHHYLDPLTALREMKRVAKANGVVLVADVAPSKQAQDAFNAWEKLRDPSHVCGLTQTEMESLGGQAGLELLRKATFTMPTDLEDLLASSFPKPGDADKIRALFEDDIASNIDRLGVAARRERGRIRLSYPIVVLTWRKLA